MNSTQDRTVLDNQPVIPADCRPPVLAECRTAVWIWRLVPLMLLATSTCGNTLCVIVLARKKLRVLSTNIFLLCLAVSDMAFMFASVSRQSLLRGIGFDIRNTSTAMCKVQTWLIHVSAGYSGWLLAFVTIDRVIMIVWPILARQNLTQRKAVIACLVLVSIMLASNAHLLYDYDLLELPITSKVGNGSTHINHTELVCLRTSTSVVSRPVRKMIDIAVLNALPVLLVIIGNAVIAVSLLKRVKRRLMKMQQGNPTAATLANKQAVVAKMLLAIGTFSLVTTLPRSVFNVVTTARLARSQDDKDIARLQLAHALLCCMFYCNFTFNFLIYVTRGSLFKEEFDSLVRSVRTVCKGNVNADM